MFIHNDWYIVAWNSEIKGGLFTRTILNQSVVLDRDHTGKVAALRIVVATVPLL